MLERESSFIGELNSWSWSLQIITLERREFLPEGGSATQVGIFFCIFSVIQLIYIHRYLLGIYSMPGPGMTVINKLN